MVDVPLSDRRHQVPSLGLSASPPGVVPEATIASIRETAQAFGPHICSATSVELSEFDETTATDGQPKVGEDGPTWRVVLDIAFRVLLVIVGIPLVWTLRHYEVVHLTAWQAAGISIALFLLAVREYTWAPPW
ncbi:hypothetical protein BKG82_26740 [Mycobacteroides chelonae]|uniref:Uncharacterized protein n=1 Tax=Mycobacteroides chelonae TaxID=1774 RepID=A0A1S1LGI2_MYCCH|nr:hypothetical protein [Mycobacteroides chelonae]OHU47255.1 hypothetical protein BKG82_26740 [Mycobacteroides chelonae]